MPAHWDTGVVVNTPTWHRLERAVLPEHITDWNTGLKEAGIDWEVYQLPVGIPALTEHRKPGAELPGVFEAYQADGFQAILRDDDTGGVDGNGLLAIQPNSYAVVDIAQFGEVIETVAGKGLKYEAIFSLYGGRQIVALLYFDTPLDIRADSGVSRTVQYICFITRFDGQGGLRGIPTSIRTICANTVNAAEALDGKAVGFTIRHTANWQEKVDEAARVIQVARKDAEVWTALANRLSVVSINPVTRDRYLARFLPTSSDMTDAQVKGAYAARDAVKALLTSGTNEHIADNAYGLLMASTEYADHVRAYRSDDSLVARQFRKEPLKARAVRVACDIAGIKRHELLASLS